MSKIKNLSNLLVCTVCTIMGIMFGFTLKSNNPKIDLPEEYKEISKDHYKPDTLLGFYIDDKLYIEFKPKTK